MRCSCEHVKICSGRASFVTGGRRVKKLRNEFTFASDHIYLIAFLLCSGHPMLRTSRAGSRVSFEFAKTPALLTDVGRFMGDGVVPARKFSFELLKLKRLLHGNAPTVETFENEEKEQCAAILKAARAYLRRGYFVVPIPAGQNHPVIKGWQRLRLTAKNFKKIFANVAGIGLILKSSKLTDIDFDCPEAVQAADVLLPATGMIHGRRSNPRSHRYFVTKTALQNKSFIDPRVAAGDSKRAVLIELRTNGQTVAPPSLHARSGERVRWEPGGKPARCDGEELQKFVAHVAAAALVGRYWRKGSRHNAALALAGMLFRGGWTKEAVEQFLSARLHRCV